MVTVHPAPEQLAAFRLGKLSDPELAELEQHIAECDSCCRQIKSLPDDSFVSLARVSGNQERAMDSAAVLAAAGAAWPAMHALLHVYGWITHGFPTDPATAVTEAVGVVLAAALGAALAWFRMKREANIEALLPSQHRQAGKELRIRRHLP